MYALLKDFLEPPEPFAVYTAEALWTDEHIASRMLAYHLNPATDQASRRPEAIDQLVRWLEMRIGLSGIAVCDLGCGPGLYAERMALFGAHVSGIDVSDRALNHARWAANAKRLKIAYTLGNYLTDPLPPGQQLVTLIAGDYGVLSPKQRQQLLARIRTILKPGGHLMLDVLARPQFGQVEEGFVCERNLMNGFWAEGDYFGFKVTHRYPERYLALERYRIVEPERQRDFYNWMQYFSPSQIEAELKQAGFETATIFDIATGGHWIEKAAPFGVLARKPHH